MNIYRSSGGSNRRTRWHRRTLAVAACASLVSLSVVSAGIGVTAASASKKPTITIWYDTARKPMVQAYIKAHPKVHVVAVLKDGDSNGDGTLPVGLRAVQPRRSWLAGHLLQRAEQRRRVAFAAAVQRRRGLEQGAPFRRARSRSSRTARHRCARSAARSTACATTSP